LIQIIKTADGSDTIYNKQYDDHYHSVNGAVTESQHVYINNGFNFIKDGFKEIKILEIGFGTGLNAFLTLKSSLSANVRVYYRGIDLFPLPEETLQTINDSINENDKTGFDYFQVIHRAKWNTPLQIHDNFTLLKTHADWKNVILNEKFHCVYYDAFAPDKQPEMWTQALLEKVYFAMENNGVFTTYTTKGEIRRILQSIGFRVNRLPGPPGKREILQAIKT
jgi:tRNA U34 5-methylaminomethyl-2-thiouridine-forming methyltransferase MnmC